METGKEKATKTVNVHRLADVAANLRTGDLDLHEYYEQICSRIDALDGRINALLPEYDRAGRLKDELTQWSLGELPLLFGVPVVVKDIYHVDGWETRAGSRLPPRVLAGLEGSCIKGLREAGAVILGKAVTTEFACFKSGPTRNPHNLAHSPGGSSSGSAAAVAAGYCPLALGSQTIGSIIRPAAFCGIVGFKPSYGRIEVNGFIHCSPSVDTIGTFTQDVAGAVLTAKALCDDWRDFEEMSGDKPVLGIPTGPYLEQVEAPSRIDFETQLTKFRAVGYKIREVPAFADIAAINHRHRQMMIGEMAKVHAPFFQEHRALYDEGTIDLVERGLEVSQIEIEAGRSGCGQLRAELTELMDAYGVDLWACPSATGPAPQGLATTGDPIVNLPWTHAGVPAISLPAGSSSHSRMPLGIQFMSRFGQDEDLLRWAAGLESCVGL